MLSATTQVSRIAAGVRTPQPVRHVTCRAATAWDSWNNYVEKRAPIHRPAGGEAKINGEVGTAIKSAAANYKPSSASRPAEATFKMQHVEKVPVKLPKDLHAKLETIGVQQLKNVLGQDVTIDAASVSYSTTDVNGALCITACIAQKDGEKIAHVAFVATETERQASWSRLEGLLLHWGCSEAAGAAWTGAPSGWTAMPSLIVDAGGAQECSFEKRNTGSQEQMYVLVLSLPVRGSLKSGGIQFVLKAKDAQNTQWLKDANTDKDFFVDLQRLPTIKL